MTFSRILIEFNSTMIANVSDGILENISNINIANNPNNFTDPHHKTSIQIWFYTTLLITLGGGLACLSLILVITSETKLKKESVILVHFLSVYMINHLFITPLFLVAIYLKEVVEMSESGPIWCNVITFFYVIFPNLFKFCRR